MALTKTEIIKIAESLYKRNTNHIKQESWRALSRFKQDLYIVRAVYGMSDTEQPVLRKGISEDLIEQLEKASTELCDTRDKLRDIADHAGDLFNDADEGYASLLEAIDDLSGK
tara:strand:- start:2121 stop:2459 length:339 start_codon:yes stop_codon:yes gene_type:complete